MSGRWVKELVATNIFVLNMLQKLELSVRAFAKHGCAERFHDLLYRNGRARELIFG